MSELSGGSTIRRVGPSRSRRAVGLITSVVGLVVIVALLASAVGVLAGWRPSLNPFGVETVDRTGSPVLKSLTEISEYHAATGHYETVVDLDKDTNNLPSWISGERVLYVGKGDVDAIVDFSELDERRISLSEETKSVAIKLPSPRAGKPLLDLQTSYVVDHNKGLLNRFKGSEIEREAQLRAVSQMTASATGETVLMDLAKKNTTAMLRGLFGSIGYTDITITFDEDPR